RNNGAAVPCTCERLDTTLNLAGIVNVKRREFDTEGLRHRTNRSKLPDTRRRRRIAKHQRSRNLGRGLLKQFGPFSAHAVLKIREASGIASRVGHVLHETRPNRIGNVHEDNWDGTRGLLKCAHRYAANAQDYVGAEREKLSGLTAKSAHSAHDQAASDLEIAPPFPTQLCKGFLEYCKPNLCLRIVPPEDVENANEAHALTLLSARRYRPCDHAAN